MKEFFSQLQLATFERCRPHAGRPFAFLQWVSLGIFLLAHPACGAEPQFPLDDWLAHRGNLVAWSAEVVQTRTLRSVARPLVTSGRVWYRAPNHFRWELGNPARTVAIREADRLVLLYPLLRRAEIYPLTDDAQGVWRSSLTLLEAGFPSSRAQLESQFYLRELDWQQGQLRIHLEPKSELARRWIARVDVTLSSADWELLATELHFADGSRLHNAFSGAASAAALPDDLFRAEIPDDYQVSQPLPAP